MDKRFLKLAGWVIGVGALFVAFGVATFDQWVGLIGMMFGAR